MPRDDDALSELWAAAQFLDTGAVAGLLVRLFHRYGAAEVWTRVCVPALHGVTATQPGDIAVEHVLSEGVRLALDMVSAPRHRAIRANEVLLCCAPGEAHCLAMHALAATLLERRVGVWLLGARVPWPALSRAMWRTAPRTVIVWAQTPTTAELAGLTRLARERGSIRMYAGGPGWAGDALPDGVSPLVTMAEAVSVCTTSRVGTPAEE